ncbi:hypothetical protein [Streptomyces sp. NPDC056479]|uniref:hypothetical protein n=1 Tax=unclassified Streptomyces TaxID=2593676 RepID=UPI0036B36844
MGFVIPARNGYNSIIAYLAVLPARRGHGYIDEILAEGTRVLAEQKVPRIRTSQISATLRWRMPSSAPATSISNARST